MNLKLTTFFAAIFFGLGLAARADLVWEQKTIEQHAKAGDAQTVAHFKFENKGKTPVTIKSVHSSCGCTVAASTKNQIAPGEKGEVTATFNIGGRVGKQEKAISVETDDPAQPMLNLLLIAEIDQPLEIQPSLVYWQAGEEPKAKTIVVKVGKDVKITKLDVATSNADFTTKVEKKSATEYTISVQPKDTAQMANATLTIKSDLPQPYYVTARVTPAAGAVVR